MDLRITLTDFLSGSELIEPTIVTLRPAGKLDSIAAGILFNV